MTECRQGAARRTGLTLLLLFTACSAKIQSHQSQVSDVPVVVAAGNGASAVAGASAAGIAGAASPAFPPATPPASPVAVAGAPAPAMTTPPRAPMQIAGAPSARPPGLAGAPAPMMQPAGAAGMAAPAGMGEFEAERQACVDTINMYRATLMLAPLKRGTPEQETCSDAGAKKDGDANAAHSSAGSCRGLGGQNTCPGYPVSAGSTLTKTLQSCLQQMWAEGEPPVGTQACIQDSTGCFQKYGHWINMSMANYGTVACGFYKMTNGRYWMNQNFGR